MNAPRKNIMLGTAGHVDHGKTALVKLLTGCETDTLAEEKQRGLTIDLGFAPCRLADQRVVGIVDVPGHVDFVRNMVAGAHGIDIVIFVVAADDGIMPQTHEHLHILTLMGLRHGLIALTKTDLVDAGRQSHVIDDLRRMLAKTFLADAPICPISNLTGEGFERFFEALNEAVAACQDRSSAGLFRVWVEDAFTVRGSGTVITGIPASGVVRPGDRLTLLPPGISGRVRCMQVYGEDAAEARAGECVALNLPDIDHSLVRRGMILSESDAVAAVIMAEAELQLLDSVKGTFEDYQEAQLHVGTAAVLAHIAMLESKEMTAGQKQMVQFRLAEPLALVPGERYVVRANANVAGQSGLTTIGGGRVLGVSNVRLRRKKPWTLELLAARREVLDDPVRWCELMLRESRQPLTAGELQRRTSMRTEETAAAVEQLRSDGRVIPTPSGRIASANLIEQTTERILSALRNWHASNPQRAGLRHDELAAAIEGDTELFDLALESLTRTSRIAQTGTVVAEAGWKPQITDPDQQLSDQVAAAFQQAGWSSPMLPDLAVSFHEPPARMERIVGLLCDRSVLVRLDERLWMHRDAIAAAQQIAVRLFSRAPSFSTMEFRDALAVSRKFAVPLLDHLDKTRFTVRSGHNRTPGTEAKKRE